MSRMSWTQTDLDNVEAAIASGVLTCEVNGRRVTYQTTADLLRVRSAIRVYLDGQSSGSTSQLTPRYQVASFADD
jgi:hypothetical protein